MKIIGVVGGIGSGKSTVARYLADLGSGLIEVDKITHEVLELPEIRDLIRARFTKYDFTPQEDPARQRKAIANVVLNNEQEFRWLEDVTGSIVEEKFEQRKSRYQGIPALTVDAPLLFEMGWDKYCDLIVFVKASDDVRCERYIRRTQNIGSSLGGELTSFISEHMIEELTEKWRALEARQMLLSQKEERANWIVNNDERYQLSTEEFWRVLVGQEPHTPAWARAD